MSHFRTLLEKAKTGDKAAVEQLLLLFMPAILNGSRLNGRHDPDLQQFILLRIIQSLPSFKIR